MSLLVDACRGKPASRTPVWIMRQAGRYLPEYQALRDKHNFHTLLTSPDLVTEVTLQPVSRFDFDAAILFSDILVIPALFGHEFHLDPRKGPVFANPLDSRSSIQRLSTPELERLDYVFESIRLIRAELDPDKALIGFSGAPWTIAAYLVEGRPTHDFRKVRRLMYADPGSFSSLLEKLKSAVIEYVKAQIQAGVDVIQLFESHAGLLTRSTFKTYSLPALREITAAAKESGIPVIIFARGAGGWLDLIRSVGADVIGVDWTLSLDKARSQVGEGISLQGNLDPAVLYGDRNVIEENVKEVLRSYGTGHRHVFNLGHGIYPDTPVESVQVLVDTVRQESRRYHPLPEETEPPQ